jgi:arabinogalactan endo-1,4-beta-galactosidase
MKLPVIIFIALILISCNNENNDPNPVPDTFMRGADLSFLPEIESYNLKFFDPSNNVKDILTILREAGCNTVRLRLWHTPQNAHSGFSEVAAFSKRIKEAGMKVYLTVHFSDTWADPGQQATPAAWQGLSLAQLKDSVYHYVERVVTSIQPDYISLGNEINGGMLWETGRINNGTNLYQLLEQAALATRLISPSTKIIIHFAGLDGSDWFFSQIKFYDVDYDIIGISYYPTWHGKDLDSLQTVISSLAADFSKPVLIAETAYPFTLEWEDQTNNVIGLQEQLIPSFPATPQGQLDFMTALRETIASSINGIGFCYWGGEWIAYKGPLAVNGSNWENQALFDFDNHALPVLSVFIK